MSTPFSSDHERSFVLILQLLDPILKEEIALMRNILTNLHQEELSLLERKNAAWQTVMEERSELVLTLFHIRQKRNVLLQTAKPPPKDSLQQAEITCQISSQMDQLIALIERANLQNCRNDALFHQAKEEATLPLYCSYPHPLRAKEKPSAKKRVVVIATDPQTP